MGNNGLYKGFLPTTYMSKHDAKEMFQWYSCEVWLDNDVNNRFCLNCQPSWMQKLNVYYVSCEPLSEQFLEVVNDLWLQKWFSGVSWKSL